jgi:uncharacterized delta-60 repeat protein
MSSRASFAIVMVATFGLAACGEFGSDNPTTATPPDPDAGTPTPDGGLPPVGGEAMRGITLTVGEAGKTAFVMQSKTATVPMKLERRNGSVGAVLVTVKGLPTGATADPLTIAAGANEGTLTVHAASTTPQGAFSLDLTAVEQVANGASATAKLAAFVRGLPGTLDTTFGTGGIIKEVFTVAGSGVTDARVSKTGSILLAGRRVNTLTMLRYSESGVVDATFAGGGNLNLATSQGGLFLDVQEGKTAADSFISATGGFGSTVPLARTTLDGTLVTTFATTGIADVTLGLGVCNGAQTVALPDGKSLLLTVHSGAMRLSVVSRWKADGTLDGTYGVSGLCQLTANGTGSTSAGAGTMIPRPDGSVQVAMSTADGKGFVKGCTAIGALDTTIGATVDHLVLTSPSVTAARAANGGIVFLGPTSWWRMSSALSPDTTIGTNGDVGISPLQDATSLLTQQDGGVVVGGMGTNAGAFTLVRYQANGLLDPAFGVAGIATIEVTATNSATLSKLVAQPDGRILVLGTQFETADGFMARIWP